MATIDLLHEIKGFPYLSVPLVGSAFYSSGLGRMRYAPTVLWPAISVLPTLACQSRPPVSPIINPGCTTRTDSLLI